MTSPEWRQSTKQEIRDYYNEEFPERISELPWWITPNNPKQYALAFTTEHEPRNQPLDKDFIRRDTRQTKEKPYINEWDEVLSFIQKPASNDPMVKGTDGERGLVHPEDTEDGSEPVPRAVYYGLDSWDSFWVLAFDIDAKDVYKSRLDVDEPFDNISKETVKETGVQFEEPTPHVLDSKHQAGDDETEIEYLYTYKDIRDSIKYAFKLREWLTETIGFTDSRIYYSGQGAHVYAFRDDPYYKYTRQTRRFLTTYIREKLQIPVDDAVTWDSQRVMRVPYSLHTGVNRVVTEVTTPTFDFKTDAVAETNLDMKVSDTQ